MYNCHIFVILLHFSKIFNFLKIIKIEKIFNFKICKCRIYSRTCSSDTIYPPPSIKGWSLLPPDFLAPTGDLYEML